ncbi:MAG: carbohydrate ABC transporter permease [Acholeplasmatales bacterium]
MQLPLKLSNVKIRKKIANILYHTMMIIICFIALYPFVWTFTASFKTASQIYSGNPFKLWPNPFTLENYQQLFRIYDVPRMVFNGLYLAVVIPFISMFLSSMGAYAIARLEFRGKNIIFLLLISTMMIPSHVTLIPNFAIMVKLGLLNTHSAIILRSALSGSAASLFLFRQYFLSVPKDLENAAIMDGCSWAGVYFRIILPNSKPVIATVIILSFRETWNAFLWPSIILQKDKLWTWTLGLKVLSEFETNQAIMMAGAVISILPIIIIYILFQKYFTNSQIGSGFTGV